MNKPKFVYVTYIATTPEKLWEALTNGDFTEQYFFGSRVESDWSEGSEITYSRNGEVTDYGKVLTFEPHSKLSFTWTYKGDKTLRDSETVVTFQLQQMNETVKLTLKHENLAETDLVEKENTFEGFNNGWPAVMSNLKTFLETGVTLPPVVV
ncbi:SRPBCC family protein [Fictibacillus barbaricus]|uniref:Uncharacterized protein YndB with AHSA1/START domain n=1 Tax=Fictibacillus barbaricus TaxID=182136 RepID=A0ABU1TWF7_9BACL|nr:SRPBCC family protein [Fictibacillus barbaricus]MDR7071546.1 uncharacterized protein YndB with AHSA1/START domain [Fictibacillus barbaricus]